MRCAFYEKEITPPLECEIPGYFNPRVAEDVQDRLYVKAAVFENEGEVVALVVADAVRLSKELCEKICYRVERLSGIRAENIMVIATHSHTAIPVGSSTIISPDDIYLDVFCRLAADCVILAYKRLSPATLRYAKGYVDSISFVRNYRMKDGSIKTNPGRNNPDIVEACDRKDPDLPILVVYDEKGKPMGAVTNFACHLDCVATCTYSGDYASVLSCEYKKVFGEQFVSLFIMGTAGNINHVNPFATEPRGKDHYVKMGKTLAKEAFRVLQNAEELKNPKLCSRKEEIVLKRRYLTEEELHTEERLAAKKEVIDAQSKDRSLGVCYRGYIAERIVHYAKDKHKDRHLPLQVLTIGECTIFGFPAEIYVKFGRDIKENADSDKVFIATLANGSFGYIPTPDLFEEKDMYEVRVSSAEFEPEAGDIMVKKLLELQKQER